jgi:hypothetical protein
VTLRRISYINTAFLASSCFSGRIQSMSYAFGILLGLISLCPVIVTMDGHVLPYLILLLLSAGLILVAVELEVGDAQHMCQVVSRPLVLAAAFPAVLMILQMLPLPFFANPVWTSVNPGFPGGIKGSISVDVGQTALTLVLYLAAAGMVLLATAVAINRERAESVLIGITAATVLISLISLLHDLFDFQIVALREEALDAACLGVTLSAACALFVYKRHEKRRSARTRQEFYIWLIACVISLVICAGAVAAARSGSLLFAAGSGLLTFCAVTVIRRWALGRLGAAAIGITAAVIAAALVTVAATDTDPRFAFVKKEAASVELTQRILNDAPFLGDGAGSFRSLLPIYQSSDPGAREPMAVTTAAKLSIEMGKTVLWITVLAASFAVFAFLRAASRRGRDSSYAAAAGACLVTLMNLAFVNVGLASPAIVLLSAAIFGLGLAQSKGHSIS